MDEEQLKALLGENFQNAQEFFKGKVLATGEYVNKGKAEAEKNDIKKLLDAANQKIKDNMSEDEKKQADVKAKDDLIAQLQAQLQSNKVETSKSKAISGIAEATTLIGIKSDDKDFVAFIENISTDDTDKTISISQYVNKLIKDSYEKGKAEATKQNLGKIGGMYANGVGGSSENKGQVSKAEELAKTFTNKKQSSNYFKN